MQFYSEDKSLFTSISNTLFFTLFRVVSFSRPVRFKEVYIGRCADLPANAMQGMEADMKV